MPYTTVVAGTSITASWGNANVRDQVVTPFADSSARSSAIASPVDGMISVLTTTDRVDVYNGTSYSALVAPSNGALTAWTPVITQGATPTFTNTASTYIRTGRWVEGYFNLVITATPGTAANLVTISLPVTALGTTALFRLGTGDIFDTSAAAIYPAALVLNSSTTMKFDATAISGPSRAYLGSTTFNAALAVGDTLSGTFQYEAAADG